MISPLLSLLVIGLLLGCYSLLLLQVSYLGFLWAKGTKPPLVSYLLFVDDTISCCDNDCEQMVNLRCILIWFEAGLQVNLAKSSILPVAQMDNI